MTHQKTNQSFHVAMQSVYLFEILRAIINIKHGDFRLNEICTDVIVIKIKSNVCEQKYNEINIFSVFTKTK